MGIVRSVNWHQPQGVGVIDWGNPITRGLAFAATGPQWIDSVLRLQPTTRTTSFGSSVMGRAIFSPGSASMQYSNANMTKMLGGGMTASALAVASTTNWGQGPSDIIRCDGFWTPYQCSIPIQNTIWTTGSGLVSTSYTNPTSSARVLINALSLTAQNFKISQDGGPYVTNAITTTGTIVATATNALSLAGSESNGNLFTGSVAMAAIWNRALSQGEATSLGVNPWQIFLPTPRRIWVSAASNTYALTGQTATHTPGTLVDATGLALTGQGATSAAGALVDSTGVALTGSAATTAVGAFGEFQWNLLPSLAATFTAGIVTDATIVALTGQSATFAAGTLAEGVALTLTGQAATFTAGTVSAGSNVTAAVTGQAATFTAGALTESAAISVTGQAATFAAGSLTDAASIAVTGQAGTFTAGTVADSTAIAVTGQAATFATGTVGVSIGGNVTVSVTGQPATFTPGALLESADIPTLGQAAAFTAGSVAESTTIAVTGLAVASATGTVTATAVGDVTAALTGAVAAFVPGSLSTGSPAGRAKRRYGVHHGRKLLVFDTQHQAEQYLKGLEQRALPPAKLKRLKLKPLPKPIEVIEQPKAAPKPVLVAPTVDISAALLEAQQQDDETVLTIAAHVMREQMAMVHLLTQQLALLRALQRKNGQRP